MSVRKKALKNILLIIVMGLFLSFLFVLIAKQTSLSFEILDSFFIGGMVIWLIFIFKNIYKLIIGK
tara:strand:- start:8494 stop:8691 length:198 start_codon:yes stop_codon:yes gene_type:complete